jgi:hypothetical protein
MPSRLSLAILLSSALAGTSAPTLRRSATAEAVPSALAPDTGYKVVASVDFEDGTVGTFTNPWGTGIDVVPDPANAGHGKVARIHYVTNATTQFDDNKALFPRGVSIGLGNEMLFQGDFYIPATARMDASGPAYVLRKLFRFGWDGKSFPHPLETELVAFGPQFQVYNIYGSHDNTAATYIDPSVATLTSGAWHRIKLQLKINSSFAASDGIVRVWVDSVLIFERTAQRWSDAAWTDRPANYVWNSWGVGYQANGQQAIDEYRYWDNIRFSIKR